MNLILTVARNVAITDINPKYVWGGDAITLDNCDMVWIDHVTVSSTVCVVGTVDVNMTMDRRLA